MIAPKGGAGALIYYLGQSEPEVAAFLKRTLTAGMTFWDIGAHLGEYSLLASKLVGSAGRIEAFEPQPDIFEFLRRNVEQNSLSNVAMHSLAISDCDGWTRMSVHPESSKSFLSLASVPTDSMPSIEVATRSLDTIVEFQGRVPHVLKVDAEGAEGLILNGATTLLELPEETAPIWVMEFETETCARFGYHPRELVAKLTDFGFITYWLLADGNLRETSRSSSYPLGRTIVASKRAISC
jgi:FkbM family methyltransferase